MRGRSYWETGEFVAVPRGWGRADSNMGAYTVRPLFKKFTQHCETYEPTNCCVKKLHNLCKIVHNLCKIVHKLCNFFTQLLVGSYVSQCCVKF